MKKKKDSRWLDWPAVATGFLVFWSIILVGVSVLWWSGGLGRMRTVVIEQMKEIAVVVILPEGSR